MKTPPFRLGIYPLGHENVELWIDPPDGGDCTGGWFQVQGPNGRRPSIHLLVEPDSGWEDVLQVLLHETREFASCRSGVRYDQSLRYDHNSAAHLFVYDHQQGSEMDQRQATFLSFCWDDLRKAHQKMQQRARRKGRK